MKTMGLWRWALLLGFVVCVFAQGSRGILETTEGRYTECARETIASGNWLEPVLNGQPHWTKPPLTYWLIAGGSALLGNNGWGARAYLVAAFLLTVVAVQLFERGLWGKPATGLAALLYATCPIAIAAANTIATDAVLTLFEAWAFASYWQAVRNRSAWWMIACWLALALAVATKGPVGLLPLTAIAPVHVLLRRRGERPPTLLNPFGLALFALVGLSWYAYMIAVHHEVLSRWVQEEIVGRLEYDAHHRISSEWFKIFENYLPIMLFGTGHWLLWLLWKQRAHLSRALPGRLLRDEAHGLQYLFLLLAIAPQFVLFAMSTSRMPLYLAPLFVPFCVAIAHGLERMIAWGQVTSRAVLRVALATALIMAAAKGVSVTQGTWKNMSDVAQSLQQRPELQGGAPIIALFRAPLNGLQYHLERRIPTVYFEQVEDPERLKTETKDEPLPTVITVANGDLLPRALEGKRRIEAGALVLVRSKDLAEFRPYFEPLGLEVITESKHWTLLRVNASIEVAEREQAAINDET